MLQTDAPIERVLGPAPVVHPPETPCSLSMMLRRLDTYARRYCLMRVGAEWEVRTFAGEVGRGLTAADAVADLLESLRRAA